MNPNFVVTLEESLASGFHILPCQSSFLLLTVLHRICCCNVFVQSTYWLWSLVSWSSSWSSFFPCRDMCANMSAIWILSICMICVRVTSRWQLVNVRKLLKRHLLMPGSSHSSVAEVWVCLSRVVLDPSPICLSLVPTKKLSRGVPFGIWFGRAPGRTFRKHLFPESCFAVRFITFTDLAVLIIVSVPVYLTLACLYINVNYWGWHNVETCHSTGCRPVHHVMQPFWWRMFEVHRLWFFVNPPVFLSFSFLYEHAGGRLYGASPCQSFLSVHSGVFYAWLLMVCFLLDVFLIGLIPVLLVC